MTAGRAMCAAVSTGAFIMEAITYTLHRNAKAAALRLIARGAAPAPDFAIVPAEGGFRIEWAMPTATGAEERAEAVAHTVSEPPKSESSADGEPSTVLAKVTDLLKRPEGATVAEIQAITGWLPHTTRAFISVRVRRKAGLEVVTEKVEGRGRVYRVAV